MIEEGLVLMGVGMGTVMAFLTTMVLVVNASSAIINKYFPEKQPADKSK